MSIFKRIFTIILAITMMALPVSAAMVPGDVVSPNAGISGQFCPGCGQNTAMYACASLYTSKILRGSCSTHADENCKIYITYAVTFVGCNNCSYSSNNGSMSHGCVMSHEGDNGVIALETCCHIINGSYTH